MESITFFSESSQDLFLNIYYNQLINNPIKIFSPCSYDIIILISFLTFIIFLFNIYDIFFHLSFETNDLKKKWQLTV